ncbi:cbb3-type cytochrome c oxidase subunit 3, partial [Candidatus Parcubacteria bacterium]|nr:cbb3-type cytochrome c oxidase subunit 3 [Candidatus Parcubacteria bacterium]
LSVCVVSGFLICVNNVEQALSYDFETESGLFTTGQETGHTDSVSLSDGKQQSLPQMIGEVIGIILAFVGTLFLILMIYGGYIWMMAKGNEQEIEKAKSIIQNALIGIAVVLAAYAITYLVSLGIFTVT